ncbi:T9SS type A sorting domain-containing protein [Algibacter sp. 2305UL17-15]|uniref:T9SS type A sorting domain-containing protein n=1 Tax=Algibacter sp. 2305UL17-15 TaxID=3231268 RepID=UPI003458D8A1
MKNLITSILVFMFINFGFGQTKSDILQPNIDSMLVHIDKTKLTSSFLYDRTTPIANLTHFNSKDKNTSNLGYFEQALQELYKSSNTTRFKSYKDARRDYKGKEDLNTVNIGVLHVKLQSLNYNRINESLGALHFENNQITRINENPVFLEHDVLVVSPLLDYAVGSTINYMFNPDLWFEDSENEITSITANFDTYSNYVIYSKGGYKQIKLPITYKEPGYKTLKFTAIYKDGTVKTTYGKLHVKLSNTTKHRMMDPLVEDVQGFVSTIPFQGYDETSPVYGELDYRIFYHTNNGNTQPTLLKPIIIIDGFDPGDARKIQDEDSPKPADEHNSIEEMMIYYDIAGVRQDIIPILRDLGYDVVIVNHPTYERGTKTIDGGADYIERNAMTHIALYQRLNSSVAGNGSNEELVIVGPSMGGQISRYALAYMEKHNIPHNTRLWVSIDSPHLGANIPIGVQALLNVLKDQTGSVGAIDFVDKWLGSVAAKQQLIEQHKLNYINIPPVGLIPLEDLNQDYMDGRTISQGFSETRGHPFFTQFYDNLFSNGLANSKGYPQNLRKVAIVNGSLSGSRAYKNPYTNLGTNLSGSTFDDNFAYSTAKALKIEGNEDVLDLHLATLESYFMPTFGARHKSAYFKTKKFGGWNYYHRYVTNVNSRGNMDNISGGWFPTQRELAHSVIGESPSQTIFGLLNWTITIDRWIVKDLEHVSSFIPTVSALGFKNPDFDWSDALNQNLVCTNEIPFDSYFGPDVNESHTSFTEESVDWLLEELNKNPQDPYFPVNAAKLTGSSKVCSAETYTFQNCSTPSTVQNWDVSYNLEIVNSDNNSITVDLKSPNAGGNGWIKATFSNGNQMQKNLAVGTPNVDNVYFENGIYEEGYFCSSNYGNTYEIYPNISGNLYQYRLLKYPNLNVVYTSTVTSSSSGTVYYTPSPGWYLFEARMTDACGTSDWAGFEVEYVDCSNSGGGGEEYRFAVYPNPSSSEINISKNTKEKSYALANQKNAITSLRVYGFSGNVILEKKRGSLKNINVSRLKEGMYYLEITSNENVEVHRIIIEK